jgi:hypothetical protein
LAGVDEFTVRFDIQSLGSGDQLLGWIFTVDVFDEKLLDAKIWDINSVSFTTTSTVPKFDFKFTFPYSNQAA